MFPRRRNDNLVSDCPQLDQFLPPSTLLIVLVSYVSRGNRPRQLTLDEKSTFLAVNIVFEKLWR